MDGMKRGDSATKDSLASTEEATSTLPEHPTLNCVPASSSEQIDFLKVEIEHFYKAEIHSEQRASWLLTIAFGCLALVLNSFFAASERRLNVRASPILAASAAFLFCAVAMALLALWPLRGRRGALQSPFSKSGWGRHIVLPSGPAIDLWAQQYSAHRIRAAKKAVRVVWTLLFLCLGVATGGLAILRNAGFLW
jgi:hypothetical protein